MIWAFAVIDLLPSTLHVHIVTADLFEAGITAENVNDIICYTKGPRHLNSCGVAARMLSQMWGSDKKKMCYCCGESR